MREDNPGPEAVNNLADFPGEIQDDEIVTVSDFEFLDLGRIVIQSNLQMNKLNFPRTGTRRSQQ